MPVVHCLTGGCGCIQFLQTVLFDETLRIKGCREVAPIEPAIMKQLATRSEAMQSQSLRHAGAQWWRLVDFGVSGLHPMQERSLALLPG